MLPRKWAALAIGVGLLVPAIFVSAQEKKDQPSPQTEGKKEGSTTPAATGAGKKEKTPEEFDAERKKWEKLAAPGEHHKILQDLIGGWKLKVRYHMSHDTEWAEAAGKSEFRSIHDGRFVEEETTADMTSLFGKEFRWLGLHGFNNLTNKHTVVFADNMGTAYEILEGVCDPTGRKINYVGTTEGAGGARVSIRWVLTVESKDKFTVQMFEPDEQGKEFNNIEVIGSR